MRDILPDKKPQLPRADAEAVLRHFGISTDKPALVFIRGYYLDTLGEPDVNDQNVWDDAAFVVSPGAFASFNANTDPSFVVNAKGRALAKLVLGRYQFYKGLHKGKYKALRTYPEGKELRCTRAGRPAYCSHINIHRGSSRTVGVRGDNVWSEGCLTIHGSQYDDFISLVYGEMDRHKQKVIEAVLCERITIRGGSQLLFDHLGKVIDQDRQ